MHSGEKTNKCNQCDFVSSQASNLRRHLKTHSGEKSNKCNQCDYASSYASHLRTHLKRHSGEKLNKCNQCDFASSRADTLRAHLKIHSGEKLNKCNQCGCASSNAGNSRRHLKTHSVTLHALMRAIWKYTGDKSNQWNNASNTFGDFLCTWKILSLGPMSYTRGTRWPLQQNYYTNGSQDEL